MTNNDENDDAIFNDNVDINDNDDARTIDDTYDNATITLIPDADDDNVAFDITTDDVANNNAARTLPCPLPDFAAAVKLTAFRNEDDVTDDKATNIEDVILNENNGVFDVDNNDQDDNGMGNNAITSIILL